MNSKHRIRTRIVFICITVIATFMGSALYYVQIAKGASYRAKANSQYTKPVSSVFDRGTIYFRSKDGTNTAAATVSRGYLLYINPKEIVDAKSAYTALAQYIKLDRSYFIDRASKSGDVYEEIVHRLDTSTAESIKELSIPGVNIMPESWRSYPGTSLAAQTLGIVGMSKDSSVVQGKYGLESSYDSVLGRDASDLGTNVFAQLFSGLKDSVLGSGSSNVRGDIVTTIEPTTQQYLEKVLLGTERQWKSDEVGGIIMDPETGDIVAMSSLPSFNPNDTKSVSDVSVFSNPLVEHVYEMGSIMKPLTMASALDSGVEKPNSTYNDTGTMTLNGKTIANYDGKARGVTSMQEILSQSLNVGAATIALEEGRDIFYKYMSSYGFGQKTGVDLPNEANGLIGNLKTGREIEVATAAYGQGIAVSPIEMVRSLAVLANGGYLVTPRIVREIDYLDGSTKTIESSKSGPVLGRKTVDDVTSMLIKVVDDKIAKAHPSIHWTNYSIAAKTGTAQIPDHRNGGYYKDRYLHSFFGYFPAYKPRFIVFLYQTYPKGAEYASETLTDPFSDLVKFLINYYNIAPDR